MAEKISSVDEILDFAIAREIEAYQLYMYMAKKMETPDISKLCKTFAAEEMEHKAQLELEVMKRGQVVNGIDLSDYAVDFDRKIDMDFQEMLVFAIKKEIVSIKLYTDLAAIMTDQESREVLSELAEEETQHKLRFEIEYENIPKGQ